MTWLDSIGYHSWYSWMICVYVMVNSCWYWILCFGYISVCYFRYLISNNINNIFKCIFTIATTISKSSLATFCFTPHNIKIILFKDNFHKKWHSCRFLCLKNHKSNILVKSILIVIVIRITLKRNMCVVNLILSNTFSLIAS